MRPSAGDPVTLELPPRPIQPSAMTTLIVIADAAPPDPDAARLRPHPGRRARLWATAVMAVASAVMLFVHLGAYPPWDDEAVTAMTAEGVWHTGDTATDVWPGNADGHNFMAYRNGLLTWRFHDRYTSPLQFYLVAPFVGLLGDGNWPMRLPMALCGAGTVAILLRWAWRALPTVPLLWWAAAFVLLTNFELFLFARQCRYYAPATLLTTAVAYLYCFRSGRARGVGGLSAVLVLLLSAQYLDYAAVAGCLAVDYAVWGRRDRRITWPQWAVLLLPQVMAGVVLTRVWNPVERQHAAGAIPATHTWLLDHLWLVWLNLRDGTASSLVILPLVLAAPVLLLRRRSPWLARGPVALLVFVGMVSLTTTPPVPQAQSAEIRYLAPLVPIGMATAMVAVWATARLTPRLRWAVLGLAVLTVLVNRRTGPFGRLVSSDPVLFYAELAHPQGDPYTPLIAWVRANVPAGRSVYVAPEYMMCPLMLRAPAPTYAWEVVPPVRSDFAAVAAIHVWGRVAPDYMIHCGRHQPMPPACPRAWRSWLPAACGTRRSRPLAVFWQDTFRPERVWRTFQTVPPAAGKGIDIYRRVDG